MAAASVSDEFPDIPSFWANSNGMDLINGVEMSYSSSGFSSTRTSLSSHPPSTIDGNEVPPYYSRYAQRSSKVGSPDDSGFGYQLPSPLDDEILIDPGTMDKEVIGRRAYDSDFVLTDYIKRRREQNRVAQRAFRERKESKLKQLEKRITELKTEHRTLERKYENLRTAHVRLQSGLRILLDAGGTYDNEDADSISTVEDLKQS